MASGELEREIEFDLTEEPERDPHGELLKGGRILLNHLVENNKKGYALVIGNPGEAKPLKESFFTKGMDRLVFAYGPDNKVCPFRLYGFCSDYSEMVVAANSAVKRWESKHKGIEHLISFWKIDEMKKMYHDVPIVDLNRATYPEASRLEFSTFLAFRKNQQENETTVFLDKSIVTIRENGIIVPRSYRLRFANTKNTLLLGLGTLNEMRTIVSFLDGAPHRDYGKEPYEKKIGGNRKIKMGANNIVSIFDADGFDMGSFLPGQWKELTRALQTEYEKYSGYLDTLVVSYR